MNISNIDDCFLYWKGLEDILIVKYDGVRKENNFTVIILGKEERFSPIRLDGDELFPLLILVIKKYEELVRKKE